MGKLSITLKEAIVKAELYPLATASSSGLPNVIPIKLVFIENDNELWLVDNFMTKTLKNLRQNPAAALNILVPDEKISYQIKGHTRIETEGKNYNRMKKKVLKANPNHPAKSLVIMHITEIFDCWPGSTIGNRLDN
jgi:predicted pyridoxine 5'-phosphate oxidase superfamily flavin-nucleotide-binding protein